MILAANAAVGVITETNAEKALEVGSDFVVFLTQFKGINSVIFSFSF